jgi:hypothetical protein
MFYKIDVELASVELDAVDDPPFRIVISEYSELNLLLHVFLDFKKDSFDRK